MQDPFRTVCESSAGLIWRAQSAFFAKDDIHMERYAELFSVTYVALHSGVHEDSLTSFLS